MSDGPDLDLLTASRLHNLHVSPDGARLALTVRSVAADGKRFEGAIWEADVTGDAPPRRLSPSGSDETARGFTPDGSLLFTAPRPPAPASEAGGEGSPARPPEDEPHALWVRPAGGAAPHCVIAPPAGVGEVLSAPGSATVVVSAALHPGVATLADDETSEAARKEAGVQARLVEHYPERFWDHDIGPREPRLLALDLQHPTAADPAPRDLTPAPPWPGWLEDVHLSLSDDGSRVAFGAEMNAGRNFKVDLAVVSTDGNGVVRTLIDAGVDHGALAWSPDGATIAVASADNGSPDHPPRFHLCLVDAATGAVRELAPELEEQAVEVIWTRAGDAVLVTADQRGHTPVFRVGLDGSIARLTASGAYSNLALSPDGSALYAIRSHITEAPVPVALDPHSTDQQPQVLPSPIPALPVRARLEEVTATGQDGTAIHSWLVLPEVPPGGQLPLAVLIHGGPISSWTGWHWRWSAPLLAALGWAVLLPNPRLSTGFAHEHVAAAWTDWATLPAGDILAAVEATARREDVDADRVAALGGSYGGYMANWLAVTSDRFRAIVTHASVWDLELERNTSDVGFSMDREFGDPRSAEQTWQHQSPHRRADSLHTPMLVIHGARDQRVPLSNSQSLWMALQQRGVPSRLLVYPDENHWVLKPQNARIWYQAVLAFLDEHVLGKPWRRPPLL